MSDNIGDLKDTFPELFESIPLPDLEWDDFDIIESDPSGRIFDDIDFGDLPAARRGISAGTPVATLREVTEQKEFGITIDLHLGDAESTVYTSDISEQFVDFNLLD